MGVRCSLEVMVGRKVFVATACIGSVRKPLLEIRSRNTATAAGGRAPFPDAFSTSPQPQRSGHLLRAGVPLAKPGRCNHPPPSPRLPPLPAHPPFPFHRPCPRAGVSILHS